MTRRLFISLSISTSLFVSAVNAQEIAGLDALMEICTPISATGESARAGLRDAGWQELSKPDAARPLANLIASQMWHLEAGASAQKRLDLTSDYINGFYASLGSPLIGPIFAHGDQVALVLADGDNLSCMWAGSESEALRARIDAIGGLPDIEGTVTGAKTQTVEVGEALYSRIESYAYITPADRNGPLPFAARLDRSPAQ